MKKFINKPLSEVKTGDIALRNGDYEHIDIEFFNKDFFEKYKQSSELSCFGFSSHRAGMNYSMCDINKYKLNFLDDDDSLIVWDAYKKFLLDENELWNEMLDIHGEPLFYVSDTDLNVKLNYGDVLLNRHLKYNDKAIELLELQEGDYGQTIENSIKQDDKFYEWLTSKDDKKMRVVFRGKKIIVAPEYSQYQQSHNSLMIIYISAHEGELYKVNVDMLDLSKRIAKINNGLYKVIRPIFDKYSTIKKVGIYRDWNGNLIKLI